MLTDRDKEFLIKLYDQGYKPDEAMAALDSVKQRKVISSGAKVEREIERQLDPMSYVSEGGEGAGSTIDRTLGVSKRASGAEKLREQSPMVARTVETAQVAQQGEKVRRKKEAEPSRFDAVKAAFKGEAPGTEYGTPIDPLIGAGKSATRHALTGLDFINKYTLEPFLDAVGLEEFSALPMEISRNEILENKNLAQAAGALTESIGEFYLAGKVASAASAAVYGANVLAKFPQIAKLAPYIPEAMAQGAAAFGTETLQQGEVTKSSYISGGLAAAFPLVGGIARGLKQGIASRAVPSSMSQTAKDIKFKVPVGEEISQTGISLTRGALKNKLVKSAGVLGRSLDDVIDDFIKQGDDVAASFDDISKGISDDVLKNKGLLKRLGVTPVEKEALKQTIDDVLTEYGKIYGYESLDKAGRELFKTKLTEASTKALVGQSDDLMVAVNKQMASVIDDVVKEGGDDSVAVAANKVKLALGKNKPLMKELRGAGLVVDDLSIDSVLEEYSKTMGLQELQRLKVDLGTGLSKQYEKGLTTAIKGKTATEMELRRVVKEKIEVVPGVKELNKRLSGVLTGITRAERGRYSGYLTDVIAGMAAAGSPSRALQDPLGYFSDVGLGILAKRLLFSTAGKTTAATLLREAERVFSTPGGAGALKEIAEFAVEQEKYQ